MKILIVRTFPNIINSHQYNMQEIGLAKALVRKGHTCDIVLYNGNSKDEIEYIPVSCNGVSQNICIYRLRGFNILKNGFFPSLGKLMKNYDVIQVHEYDQITSWMNYAWRKKPIVIYHGPYYHEFNKGYNFKCKIFDTLFLKLKHNKNVVCMAKSELAADFLRKKGFKRVENVGVGLDLDNFEKGNKELEEKIAVNKDKINVIYVGKIEERRNSLFLLQVMQEICNNNPRINCIVIGDGNKEYVETFMCKAKPLIESGRMQYFARASQCQLAEIYKNTQLMLFPSCYEIFGMVLLEAVYFGLPVITSKNGGSDIIAQSEDTGLIVDSLTQEAWIEAVEKFINKLTNKQSESNKYRIDISWDYIVNKFISCYEEAIKSAQSK